MRKGELSCVVAGSGTGRTHLCTTKQTPRGSVVVLGDRLLSDEMTEEDAAVLANQINFTELNLHMGRFLA